jgi:acetyl esterase/lipase
MNKVFQTFVGILISVIGFCQTEIPLYNGEVLNSKPCNKTENSPAAGRVESIINPKLYVYQPAVQDSFKTAVIICPGGGYARLAIDHEGHAVAKELNKKGITAFVLKYRNPIDSDCVVNKEWVALQDAQQAIKLVREQAIKYNIDANKVGIMGFSAGGHLASTAATHFTTTTIENNLGTNLRPSFAILIYPVISLQDSIAHKGSRNNLLGKTPMQEKIDLYSNELQVTPQTPPTFLLHAVDDKSVVVMNSIVFYMALLKNKVPAEMLLLQAGGHGFGLNNKAEPINWLTNVFAWMDTNQLVKRNVQ